MDEFDGELNNGATKTRHRHKRELMPLPVKKTLTTRGAQLCKENTFRFAFANGHKSEIMQQAEKTLEGTNLGFKIKWVDEEAYTNKLQKSKERPAGLFVLEDVTSRLCHLLTDRKCRVFGPLAIVQNGELGHLPVCEHPVMSLYFRDHIVCISNPLENVQKQQLEKYIRCMGGVVKASYLTTVNCVIAEQLTSEKCVLARSRGVRIYLPDLVLRLWDFTIKCELVNAERFFNRYPIQTFKGFTLTVSGVRVAERLAL